MEPLTFDDLRAAADAYDATVDASDLVDRFCASSDWILPARAAFHEEVRPAILRDEGGWVPLMRMDTVLGRTLLPLEASWGLAAPFVGVDRGALASRFVDHALRTRTTWDAMFLSGLERDGADFQVIVRRLSARLRLGLGQPTTRCVASLEGGWDGFLGRRSRVFRKNLRRDERRVGERLRFEVRADVTEAEADAVYAQILDVEARSWKAAEGHGIVEGPMRTFYGIMIRRLARRGALRVTFAWEDDERVGYVLGGLRAGAYRGLQISFDRRLTDLSVGNLLQRHTVAHLCEEGVRDYDLGTDMPYKRAWAEQLRATVPLVVR